MLDTTGDLQKKLKPYLPWVLKAFIAFALVPLAGIIGYYIMISQGVTRGWAGEAAIQSTLLMTVLAVIAVLWILTLALDDFSGKVIEVNWDRYSRCWLVRVDCFCDRRFFDMNLSNRHLGLEQSEPDEAMDEATDEETDEEPDEDTHSPSQKLIISDVSEPFVGSYASAEGTVREVFISGDEFADPPVLENAIVLFHPTILNKKTMVVLSTLSESSSEQ